jgi:eukaryotic-like serine/threonine-protein kinase
VSRLPDCRKRLCNRPRLKVEPSAETLIARALALPESARAGQVLEICRQRPELRKRLLAALAEALTAQESPASPQPPLPESSQQRARALELALQPSGDANQRVGSYRLLEPIGEGGFGVVWMAEQQAPVKRRVALKIVKGGMESREVIARFEAERQALALMDHPNIARVFDAGETEAGRPYFAMELVRGVPITTYCDHQKVPTAERLRLFIDICHAVQHAHQKGIIHRDLKPSNILVTTHDGRPVPKVIDFGIAKATEAKLTDGTLFTRFHSFLGTPAYTSPEQMEMTGQDVDTRTDIYSLGVLLYELLAGRPPFEPKELLQSGLEAMRRTIREKDPPRPSQRLATLDEDARTTVARQRSSDPSRLFHLLRGDLDWVVMRCLEKDRTRRYETAASLVEDVRRHLANEPVSARPPDAAYRLRKFLRRHRLGAGLGAAATLTLVAFVAVILTTLTREQAARQRELALRQQAVQTAEQARVAAATSAQVAQFMKDMLTGVGPSVAMGRDTALLRDILERTAGRLDGELREQPAVGAELRHALGRVYLELADYPTAEKLLHEAVTARRGEPVIDSAELASLLDSYGTALRRLNRSTEAEAAFQEALDFRKKTLAPNPLALAETLWNLSWVPHPNRFPEEIESMRREVLRLREDALGREHLLVAEALSGLAAVALGQFDHGRAAALFGEALEIRRGQLGPEHPAVAESLEQVAFSLHHIGESTQASDAYRESLALRRQLLGDSHPHVVIALLRFLGSVSFDQLDPLEVQALREFVQQRRQADPKNPTLAPAMLALAAVLHHPERAPAEAVALTAEARQLLAASRADGPALDRDVLAASYAFAWWRYVAGFPAEGYAMSKEALMIAQSPGPWSTRDLLHPMRTHAWILLGLDRLPEAATAFEEALRLAREFLGANHIFTGADAAALAAVYRAQGQVEQALRVLEDLLGPVGGAGLADRPAHPSAAMLLCELGLTWLQEGRWRSAERLLREALARYDDPTILPLGHRLRPRERAMLGLAQALVAQGRLSEAEPVATRAFLQLEASYALLAGDRDGLMREALAVVVDVHAAAGKREQAAEWQRRWPGGSDNIGQGRQ